MRCFNVLDLLPSLIGSLFYRLCHGFYWNLTSSIIYKGGSF